MRSHILYGDNCLVCLLACDMLSRCHNPDFLRKRSRIAYCKHYVFWMQADTHSMISMCKGSIESGTGKPGSDTKAAGTCMNKVVFRQQVV